MCGRARRPWLPLLLLALLVVSCAPGHTPQSIGTRPELPVASAAGDDRLIPLPDGPTAFRAIEAQLRSAQRSIELEMYEFQREDLASLVVDAHDRGVSITAIMDPSERSSLAVWAQLNQDGIKVVAFPVEARTIDHVKLLIVDAERAIVGGINWGRHSVENRDYDVLVTGPVVANLERVFDQDLALSGEPTVIPEPRPDRLLEVLVTRPGDGIRTSALIVTATARRSIDIEMYVLSDRLILEALAAAAHRGVRVRVLLEPTQPQNLQALAGLRAAGALARLFVPLEGQKLHAKLAIIDGTIVLFGSCNWSRSGFTSNHELDLLIDDRILAGVFLNRLSADWTASAN